MSDYWSASRPTLVFKLHCYGDVEFLQATEISQALSTM